MKGLYFDYNATSPVRPEVQAAVQDLLAAGPGNASSLHAHGRRARSAVERVRSQILQSLADPKGRLVFTSGGTEADNLAVYGTAHALRSKGSHVILSSVEHPAVLGAARALEEEGFRVEPVPVDAEGRIDLEALEQAITPETILLSVMHGNNEVGTIQPIEEIGRIARAHGVLFHTDAVQSFGKVPLDVRRCGADLLSISGHKLGGLQGTGALYLRSGLEPSAMLRGGPQEGGLRAGTESVPGIVALGAAVEKSLEELRAGALSRIRTLRDRLEQGLRERAGEVELNGHPEERLPGTLNVSFLGCEGEALLAALDLAGISVSTGSACASGSTEPSHVLLAMRLPRERVESSIRFSLGWGTTEQEIEEALERIPPVVERVRLSRCSS